jgi:hypothetical protein
MRERDNFRRTARGSSDEGVAPRSFLPLRGPVAGVHVPLTSAQRAGAQSRDAPDHVEVMMKTAANIGVALFMAMLLSPAAMAGDKHKMDTNGDGMVSAGEHSAGAKQKFDAMDANHDGNVTAAEMDARHQARMKEGKATMPMAMSSAEKIKTMDSNGDGMLSAAEHSAGAQRRFSEMDANHDGNLSQTERKAADPMAATDK